MRANLVELLLQLQDVGEGGGSAGLRAALARLGCASEHEALVRLAQALLVAPRAADLAPQRARSYLVY